MSRSYRTAGKGTFVSTVSACLILPFQLLEKKKRVQLKDMGEDLECLCQIMRTVGPRLDHVKAKVSIIKIASSFYPLSICTYYCNIVKQWHS